MEAFDALLFLTGSSNHPGVGFVGWDRNNQSLLQCGRGERSTQAKPAATFGCAE